MFHRENKLLDQLTGMFADDGRAKNFVAAAFYKNAREACVREERVGYRPTSARPCAADLARATGQRSRA